ncbi:retrovirus-related pol polyprotein from transposon TNT 1-94 [Tanacetum coccineum]
MCVIEQPLPAAPAANSEANVLLEWNAIYDAYNEVACLILGSMTPELHRQFENSSPYDMIKELKAMFKKQAGVERFDIIQTFHACKQEEGKPVAAYVIQMKEYVDQLERLGYMLPQDLVFGLILNGLTKDFAGFVRNYNMHNMGKTIGELHAMLIEYEKGLPKKAETPQVMMIKGGKIQKANKKSLKAKGKGKANGKGKDKQVYIPKPKNPKPSAKEHPAKDDACHHCKEVGHWKRKPRKEGFRRRRKMKQELSILYVGNGWGCEALVKRDTPDKLQKQGSVKCYLYRYIPSEITSETSHRGEAFEPPQEEEYSDSLGLKASIKSWNTKDVDKEIKGLDLLKNFLMSHVYIKKVTLNTIAASDAAMEAVWSSERSQNPTLGDIISVREVILKHDDLALVVNIEFVPSIVEEDATGPLVELIRCVYGRTRKLM